jgi:hypothetical protein
MGGGEDWDWQDEASYYYCDSDCSECGGDAFVEDSSNVVEHAVEETGSKKKACSKRRIRDSSLIYKSHGLSEDGEVLPVFNKERRLSSPVKKVFLDDKEKPKDLNLSSILHQKDGMEKAIEQADNDLEKEKKILEEYREEQSKNDISSILGAPSPKKNTNQINFSQMNTS